MKDSTSEVSFSIARIHNDSTSSNRLSWIKFVASSAKPNSSPPAGPAPAAAPDQPSRRMRADCTLKNNRGGLGPPRLIRFALPAEPDQCLENIEGHLLRMDDATKVMQGGFPLFHLVDRNVVFPENFLGLVFGHGFLVSLGHG
jgi:hypothetical protein